MVMMIVVTALFLIQATLVSELSSNGNLSVTITSNVTDGIICCNKAVQLTCHANDVNITAYKWTSSAFKEVKVTASITIIATDDPVGYTCTVTDTNGDNGYSSVNISSNATAPVLYEANFNMDVTVFVGNHVNLIVQVISNISLKSMLWSRPNADLPKDSRVVNYSQDGNNYTSLIIYKANYANDGGLYYLNTSNHCGPSSISVELNIDKEVECFPPGQPVPLLSITSNQTTVEEVAITYTCIFEGNYSPITYGDVYWVVKLQNGNSIAIYDYSNFTNYHVYTYRKCPQDNYACCRFVTELGIRHTTLPLNNAMMSCVAIHDSMPSYNTSNLEVIQRPVLTRGPTNVIGVMEDESVHFECHFNSSLIQYLAICDWLKDGDPTMNGDKWQSEEPGYENCLICGFSISRVSMVDEGNYSCYCHYNESFREQLHIPKSEEIKSKSGEAILELKNHESAHDDQIKDIILWVVISCLLIVPVIIVIWCLEKCRKRKSVTTSVQHSVDTDSNCFGAHNPNRDECNNESENSSSNVSTQSPCSQSTGLPSTDSNCFEAHSPNRDEYNNESKDSSSNVSTQSPCSQSTGLPSDNSDSEGSPFEQAPSATMETLLPYQSSLGNIQIRDNPDLAAVPSISEYITITEQPKDQIIQFKNNNEIVKLTCCAESFEGHDLSYQWFYKNSSDIISTEQCAEIKLKRPRRNMKNQCYCKVSIVNQPQNFVLSKTIIIQQQIVWFTDQPKDTTVFAGKELELSCTANTLQAMKVKYSWYKCSKSGYGKTPTGHVGNRMIIPVCDSSNDDYYLCEAATETKQGIVFYTISSKVVRVRVINSVNISITKQPLREVFITFGEQLMLECEASCGCHPVNYQWYNNNEPLAGATQPMLMIPSVSEKDVGLYYCIVTSEHSRAVKSQSTQVRMNYDKWNESLLSQFQAETFAVRKGKIYAKDKMALLIGNGDYKGQPLRCPRNDVKAITERLQQLNFKTLSLVDLTLSQMTDAINYFCSFLSSGMYAVFFFSGHGVELHKTTYFVPIDADDKELKIVQLINSDLVTHKLQSTLAKVIMVLDCCRKPLRTEEMEMPTKQFSEYFSFNTICKIHACATTFETFEINEHSFMTKALLQALDCSREKMLKSDVYDLIMEYYTNYNISASKGKQLIRPRMLYGLSKDLSLGDPIWPDSKAKDLLLNLPKKCILNFNNPIMKSTYESITLHFEAEFSNILFLHIYCNTAKQPSLQQVTFLPNPGLSLVELKSKGIASYKIDNLLVLMDVRERGGPSPKLQCTFHMSLDTSVIDRIEYVFP